MRLRLGVPAAVFALIVLTGAASAQGTIDLSWDQCDLTPATADRTFACDTDGATFVLIGSFTLDAPMTGFTGAECTVRVTYAGDDVPDWWRLSPGDCRAGLPFQPRNTNSIAGCPGNVNGLGSMGGWAVQDPAPQPYQTVLRFSWGSTQTSNLSAGVRRAAAALQILSTYTVTNSPGGAPCAGCSRPACLTLEQVKLYPGDVLLTQPGTRTLVTWQGGHDLHGNCPGSVPARNATWGTVKSLYR